MKRRLVNLSAFGSLLICVCAAGAWMITTNGWGYWRALQGPHRSYIASLTGGYLVFQIAGVSPDRERPATAGWQWFGGPDLGYFAAGTISDRSIFSRVGLISTLERIPYNDGFMDIQPNAVKNSMSIQATCRSFIVPLWLIALIAAMIPFRWTRQRVHERIRQARMREGRCGMCGYDLRGSAERCPECGALANAGGATVLPAGTDAAQQPPQRAN
jgi:hypothetical protein